MNLTIPVWHRIISIFMYMIPWSSALNYGSSIFNNFPTLKFFIMPTLPILFIKETLPIGDFIIFFILFLGVARNNKISYFIRFNTMQAILLNLVLIIISYMKMLLFRMSGNIFIFNNLESFVFIISLTIILFASIQSLRGLEADIPGISNSAKIQI